jgi:hypothetical protein
MDRNTKNNPENISFCLDLYTVAARKENFTDTS